MNRTLNNNKGTVTLRKENIQDTWTHGLLLLHFPLVLANQVLNRCKSAGQ